MTAKPAPPEIQTFRNLVAERLGLQFEDGKMDMLADILRERMEETGCREFSAYRNRILSMTNANREVAELAERLTVNETYFFRYAEHFEAFAEEVIPSLVRARRQERRLRILSAGCASGEEPYSLAVLMHERFPKLANWDVQILGFDVNPAVVRKAVRAKYSTWSLRETPANLQAKYFHPHGRDFLLDESLRTVVVFEQRNLVEDDPLFWSRESFDAIFCRNVMMYFTNEIMRSVVRRFTHSLAPGGFLFLGHAETLRGISQEFHLRHTHECFYYQRREHLGASVETNFELEVARGGSGLAPHSALPDATDSWFTTIRRASERITNLTQTRTKSCPGTSGGGIAVQPQPDSSEWDRTRAMDLLRREQFSEAMALVRSLPVESKSDPDTQLLFAVLLTNRGDLQEAERVCQHIFQLDELNAGAHYLMALCREHAGDQAAATQHDRAAAYLDASFAMPHLHLGLVAKRSADIETARRELGQALPLLSREDASRILFFGGGFTRDTLIELCRAELRACGVVS